MAECVDLQHFNDNTTIRVRSGGLVDGWVAAYSTCNETHRCRTPAVELETGERLVRLVELSPPPSIVEYSILGNEGTMGLGGRLRWISARPRRFRDGTIEFIRAGYTQAGRLGNHGVWRTFTLKPRLHHLPDHPKPQQLFQGLFRCHRSPSSATRHLPFPLEPARNLF